VVVVRKNLSVEKGEAVLFDDVRYFFYITNIYDLAAEIVRLSADNLALQRELLTRYCQAYDQKHIADLWEAWEERAAIMEYDGGLSRHEAEYLAAKRVHLLAFMDIRNCKPN